MDFDLSLFAPIPERGLRHANQACGFLDPKVIPESLRQNVCSINKATKTLPNFAILAGGPAAELKWDFAG
jgi:hypothetical protein